MAYCRGSTSHPEWVNSVGQDPCAVAEDLGQVCDSGFYLPLLTTTRYVSSNPSSCYCSVPMYNLMQACQWCQPTGLAFNWTTYSSNCTSGTSVTFPATIPSSIIVPTWANVDTRTSGWDVGQPARYNTTTAVYTSGSVTFTSIRSATTTRTSFASGTAGRSSTTSARSGDGTSGSSTSGGGDSDDDGGTPIGAIVGGVVGGVVLLAAILGISLFFCLRNRRRKATAAGINNGGGQYYGGAAAGEKPGYNGSSPPLSPPSTADPYGSYQQHNGNGSYYSHPPSQYGAPQGYGAPLPPPQSYTPDQQQYGQPQQQHYGSYGGNNEAYYAPPPGQPPSHTAGSPSPPSTGYGAPTPYRGIAEVDSDDRPHSLQTSSPAPPNQTQPLH